MWKAAHRNWVFVCLAFATNLGLWSCYLLKTGVRIINLSCHEVKVSRSPVSSLKSCIKLIFFGCSLKQILNELQSNVRLSSSINFRIILLSGNFRAVRRIGVIVNVVPVSVVHGCAVVKHKKEWVSGEIVGLNHWSGSCIAPPVLKFLISNRALIIEKPANDFRV